MTTTSLGRCGGEHLLGQPQVAGLGAQRRGPHQDRFRAGAQQPHDEAVGGAAVRDGGRRCLVVQRRDAVEGRHEVAEQDGGVEAEATSVRLGQTRRQGDGWEPGRLVEELECRDSPARLRAGSGCGW